MIRTILSLNSITPLFLFGLIGLCSCSNEKTIKKPVVKLDPMLETFASEYITYHCLKEYSPRAVFVHIEVVREKKKITICIYANILRNCIKSQRDYQFDYCAGKIKDFTVRISFSNREKAPPDSLVVEGVYDPNLCRLEKTKFEEFKVCEDTTETPIIVFESEEWDFHFDRRYRLYRISSSHFSDLDFLEKNPAIQNYMMKRKRKRN